VCARPLPSRLPTQLIVVCGLLVTACGAASGSTAVKPSSMSAAEPWNEIARGGNSRTLLIDVFQGTRDRSSSCYIRYTTRVVTETAQVIKIELLRPPPPHGFARTAQAVRGPFSVTVRLKRPYRRQQLIDAYSGRRYPLISVSDFQ